MPEEPKTTNKKAVGLIIALILLLVVTAVASLIASNNASKKSNDTAKSITPSVAIVKVSETGFTPASLTVNKGTVVIWKIDESTNKTVVIASNPYPKDDDLISLKSTQIGAGASYRYQFNKVGTYKYHDDLNPTINGTVVVK